MRALLLGGRGDRDVVDVADPPPERICIPGPPLPVFAIDLADFTSTEPPTPFSYTLAAVGEAGAVYLGSGADSDMAADYAHDPDLWDD